MLSTILEESIKKYLKLIKKPRKITTRNWLDLGRLGFGPILPQNLHGHCVVLRMSTMANNDDSESWATMHSLGAHNPHFKKGVEILARLSDVMDVGLDSRVSCFLTSLVGYYELKMT